MTMKELCTKFLSLLHYVPYIIDGKPKIEHFLSFLPHMFKERVEYDNLKMLEQVMINENLCYVQNINKRGNIPKWKTKRHDNLDQRKKNTKFWENTGNNYWGYQGNNYKKFKPQIPRKRKDNQPPPLIKALHKGNH